MRGTADPFRQDITGSDKSYPFRYEGNGNQLFVFEAPIDLLSFICLYPQDWQTRSYLALGGVSGKALDRFLSERKDTQKEMCIRDRDNILGKLSDSRYATLDAQYEKEQSEPVSYTHLDVYKRQGRHRSPGFPDGQFGQSLPG